MLLLHTLSRLTFSDQAWKPLLAGFLLHFSACEGFKPRLNHCVFCGEHLPEEGPFFFDIQEGGICCQKCKDRRKTAVRRGADFPQPLAAAEVRWMRKMLQSGSASWVDTQDAFAPFSLLRAFVETHLGRKFRSGILLPAGT